MATIVFDLDGTLVHTAPDLLATTNAVLAEEGVAPVDRAQLNNLVGQGGRAMLARALGERGEPADDTRLDRLVPRFLALYEASIPGGSVPFEGAVPMLDALRAHGHALAVCTNKFERLSRLLLEALDLDDRFAAICGPDTFDVRKPDPEHLVRTVRAAGGVPDEAVMVGDSRNDILAAQRAGIPSIGVTFGYTDEPVASFGPEATVDALAAIDVALIDRLLAARA